VNLMKHRRIFYGISLALIIPGTIALIMWGLRPSIDFTGGSRLEIRGTTDVASITKFAEGEGLKNVTVERIGTDGYSIRFKEVDEAKHSAVKKDLPKLSKTVTEVTFETVGPTISKEITQKAFGAVALAAIFIIIFIGYSFRKVPYPANSWEFGFAAIVALLHDVLLVCGIFAIMGHFWNVEVDPLFITAILTVIGFSVHDTIVIFDRIRENLIRSGAQEFEEVVNRSVVEMLPRTLNTSFLVWVILLILLVFGGTTIRFFVLTLVIGIFSGTYSSILNAAPLLVTWEEFKKKRKTKK
jgi:preprotein translocase subunit SecF